jgi:hypothetical protein
VFTCVRERTSDLRVSLGLARALPLWQVLIEIMQVVQERRRCFTSIGGQVAFILRDPGGGEWSELEIVFGNDAGRAIVSLDFDDASNLVDFLDAALLRPAAWSEVQIRGETGSVLAVRRENDPFTFELTGADDFQASVRPEDAAAIRNVVQTFVDAVRPAGARSLA